MTAFKKPKTINLEIILNSNKVMMSKMDNDGFLEFANDYFVEVSGYEEYELMGKSISCTQHPDMPEVIFKRMWEKLLERKNCRVLVKNLAKNGKYYWTISNFSFKTNDDTTKVVAIYNRSQSASKEAIRFFSKLYNKLKNIEIESGIALSDRYLVGYLEEFGKSFNELLEDHITNKKQEKPTATVSILLPKQKDILKKEKSTIKKRIEKTQNKIKKAVDKTTIPQTSKPSSTKKKSFFQKMFGKTEKELEEERRRNNN